MNTQEWQRWTVIARNLTRARDTLVFAAEDHSTFGAAKRAGEETNEREAIASLARLADRHANYRGAVSSTIAFAESHGWSAWDGVEQVGPFIPQFDESTGDYVLPDGRVVDLAETITGESP